MENWSQIVDLMYVVADDADHHRKLILNSLDKGTTNMDIVGCTSVIIIE